MTTTTRTLTAAAVACLLGLAATSCGDDADTTVAPTVDPAPTTTATPTASTPTITVTAVDYGFEGLPDTIEAGTRLSLRNEGREPHELVAMRIPDDETRSVEELLGLPQPELTTLFGDAGPTTVILAAAGETDLPGAVVGDGTLMEPGRYAIVCFIPVGSDDSALDPGSQGPPPGDAPPHVAHGMWAEVTVE